MSDRTSANKTMIIDFTIYNFLENGEIFFNLIQDYRKRGVSLTNFLYQLFVEYDELINSNVIKLIDCNQMIEYFVENFNIHCESDFYNLLRNQDLFMIDLDIPYKRTCTMNMTNMQHQMVYERLKDFSQEEAAMEIYKSLRQHVVMKKDPYYMKIQTEILFNGEFIDLSTASPHRINMFDILPMSSPEEKFLGGESYVEKSWLIDKIDNLKIWFKYIVPDLSIAELAILEKTLMQMYEDFGITPDNDSIYEDSEHTTLKKMPIMQNFYDRISNIPNLRQDIPTIFEKFINGAARNMNGETNVDLNNLFIVFGMENIDDSLLAPTLFMILEYVWAKCRQNRTVKKMISIDEGWQLLNGQDQQVGAFVEHIFKVIRGYGGGALFATQSIADLFQNERNYGNAILSCSNSKIILGMEKKDLDMISSELGLSAYEASSIISSDVGEALLCAGNNHIPIKVKTSEYEHQLFTTRRADLESIYKNANR